MSGSKDFARSRRAQQRATRVLAAAVGAGAIFAYSPTARATNWAAAVNGNFNDGTKWTGGIAPSTLSDSPVFSSGSGTYAVTFTNSPTVGSTSLSANNVVTYLSNG